MTAFLIKEKDDAILCYLSMSHLSKISSKKHYYVIVWNNLGIIFYCIKIFFFKFKSELQLVLYQIVNDQFFQNVYGIIECALKSSFCTRYYHIGWQKKYIIKRQIQCLCLTKFKRFWIGLVTYITGSALQHGNLISHLGLCSKRY